MNRFLCIAFAVACAVAVVSGDVSHLPEVKNQYAQASSTAAPNAYTPGQHKTQYSPSPVISNRGIIGQQTPTVYSAAVAAAPASYPGYSAASPASYPGYSAASPASYPGYSAASPASYPGYSAASPASYNQYSAYPYAGYPASSGYASPLSAYPGSYSAYPGSYSAGSYPSAYSAGSYPSAYSAAYPSAGVGQYSGYSSPSFAQYPPQYQSSSYPSSVGAQYPSSSNPSTSYPAGAGYSYPSQLHGAQYTAGSYPTNYHQGGYYPVENSHVTGQYTQTSSSAIKPYPQASQYNKPAYSVNPQSTSTPSY